MLLHMTSDEREVVRHTPESSDCNTTFSPTEVDGEMISVSGVAKKKSILGQQRARESERRRTTPGGRLSSDSEKRPETSSPSRKSPSMPLVGCLPPSSFLDGPCRLPTREASPLVESGGFVPTRYRGHSHSLCDSRDTVSVDGSFNFGRPPMATPLASGRASTSGDMIVVLPPTESSPQRSSTVVSHQGTSAAEWYWGTLPADSEALSAPSTGREASEDSSLLERGPPVIGQVSESGLPIDINTAPSHAGEDSRLHSRGGCGAPSGRTPGTADSVWAPALLSCSTTSSCNSKSSNPSGPSAAAYSASAIDVDERFSRGRSESDFSQSGKEGGFGIPFSSTAPSASSSSTLHEQISNPKTLPSSSRPGGTSITNAGPRTGGGMTRRRSVSDPEETWHVIHASAAPPSDNAGDSTPSNLLAALGDIPPIPGDLCGNVFCDASSSNTNIQNEGAGISTKSSARATLLTKTFSEDELRQYSLVESAIDKHDPAEQGGESFSPSRRELTARPPRSMEQHERFGRQMKLSSDFLASCSECSTTEPVLQVRSSINTSEGFSPSGRARAAAGRVGNGTSAVTSQRHDKEVRKRKKKPPVSSPPWKREKNRRSCQIAFSPGTLADVPEDEDITTPCTALFPATR
ncbi:unnamed protein product [Amoebophrya sp. A25]|nr:unnamed protein product [Amoebophrya sp. A25]|eukprot:GSA25T00005196001.1